MRPGADIARRSALRWEIAGFFFIIALGAGQYVSYRIMTADERSPYLNRIAPLLIIALAVLFIVFTFLPPEAGLFRDGATGAVGIPG